ncbi:OpgC domain-containing protein [Methylobacterium sp. E-041]|uniref:OpgC family protein n=1 Tax=unclassified Methylobacterium TaxID=2615210 RepID=UPI001FB8DC3F|nr:MULTISPECIES: OpgC domain-containing protein [unclassified Methylobacterium]MCJ2040990.1 OpgC domain-containing protein [Methylobacterium sp. J-059]MCJ2076703.1 OpgC domain-containing protein [Methylobacterium sp. E-016]MCJ2107390.1 OpgC domain-containing protein [Methylobacterium sp. E-041]MCJ2114151.1 OpgC domain-containing protein [Methylobacterium sp. E-025]
MTDPAPASRKRDPRVDVLRGLALLIIFIDHIPNNAPALITPHNLGFSDAAELFVLFAGYSATVAYGGLFRRAGVPETLKRIAMRCLRIYVFQAGLLLATLLIVRAWMDATGLVPRFGVAPLLQMGLWSGLWRGLLLNALPNYLDILPLYIVLLAAFPLYYAGIRRSVWAVLSLSGLVWVLANLDPALNLPNAAADDGWYFNPFAWQFLFAIGMALAVMVAAGDGLLPRRAWLTAACWAYLAVSLFQAVPWDVFGLPDMRPFEMAVPDKARVSPLRLLHILALIYLLFGSPVLHRLATSPRLRPLEWCGRHSLEVFALGCLAALIGRISYRTFGPSWPLQVGVNLGGLAAMIALAWFLDRRARLSAAP